MQLKTVIDSVMYAEIQDCHMLILFTQILCAVAKLPSDTSKTNSYILTCFSLQKCTSIIPQMFNFLISRELMSLFVKETLFVSISGLCLK